jgi:hypothetical protein
MQHFNPKLAAVMGAMLALASCASIGPPLPPSLELPSPPSDLRAARKGDAVTLTWTVPTRTTDRQTIRTVGRTLICRGLQPVLRDCSTPAGRMEAPAAARKSSSQNVQATYQATFVDTLTAEMEREHPLELVTYAVDVLNVNGRGAGLSNQVRVPLASTLPAPRDFGAQVTSRGVVLTWAGATRPSSDPQRHYVYRVYRRAEDSQQLLLVGELPVVDEAKVTFNDPGIEWEKTYYYRANVTTVATPPGSAEVRVEGNDTREVEVFAHDIFPPGVPTGVQAVYSGPGQRPFIDLIWAPVADVDLAGYNVYRREGEAAPVKVNAELIKTPAYRDAEAGVGKTYFYSVSSVDVRGNESVRSEEAGERVP